MTTHEKYISDSYGNTTKRSWNMKRSGFTKNLFLIHFGKRYLAGEYTRYLT